MYGGSIPRAQCNLNYLWFMVEWKRISKAGGAAPWYRACLVCFKPWVLSLAPGKHNYTICLNFNIRDAVLMHPFLVTAKTQFAQMKRRETFSNTLNFWFLKLMVKNQNFVDLNQPPFYKSPNYFSKDYFFLSAFLNAMLIPSTSCRFNFDPTKLSLCLHV